MTRAGEGERVRRGEGGNREVRTKELGMGSLASKGLGDFIVFRGTVGFVVFDWQTNPADNDRTAPMRRINKSSHGWKRALCGF